MKEELKLKVNELKRNNIVDHAEKLFSELGIENTTMDIIAKDAGISKRTVYTYFSSKTELYQSILYRANKEMYERFYTLSQKSGFSSLDPREKLWSLWTVLINFKKEKNLYFKIIAMYENQKEDFETTDKYLKKSYEWGEKSLSILKEIIIETDSDYLKEKNPDEIVLILWMTSVNVLNTMEVKKLYLENSFDINEEDFQNTFFEYMISPFFNNK